MAAGFGDKENWAECRSYFICGGPYGTAALKPDLDRAKALLKAAGQKGETLVFPSTHEIAWGDWGTTAGRQSNRGPPDKGGWNLFATGASGPTMHSPLTNIGTNMTCNGRNFPGWPCDEEAERLRQAFLDANNASRPAALDALHTYLAMAQLYIFMGQYQQPVALRSSVTGFLESSLIVYWSLNK